MKKSKTINILTCILVIISVIVAFFLYQTINEKKQFLYSLNEMKPVITEESKDQTVENEINNVEVLDLDFPFLETKIQSTARDCSSIGISIFQQYQINTLKNKISEMEFGDLQYESNKIISGELDDFIIEITLNTRLLDENANLLKEYMEESKNRPLLRTRLHIKATGEPFEYEIIKIGKDLA